MVDPKTVLNAFSDRFSPNEETVRLFRAPGRVNLIGEHTDYNEGFVMPVAINFSTFVAIGKRDDHLLKIHSDTFKEDATVDLSQPPARKRKHWSDYPVGVA